MSLPATTAGPTVALTDAEDARELRSLLLTWGLPPSANRDEQRDERRRRRWVHELWQRGAHHVTQLHRPDAWVHPRTFEVSWRALPGYLALRPGDTVYYSIYSSVVADSGVHHLFVYLGRGFVAGLLAYPLCLLREAHIGVEFLADCFGGSGQLAAAEGGALFPDGGSGSGSGSGDSRTLRHRPRHLPQLRRLREPLSNVERLRRLHRVLLTTGYRFRYDVVFWNCQNMHAWWTRRGTHHTEPHALLVPALLVVAAALVLLTVVYQAWRRQWLRRPRSGYGGQPERDRITS
jgi:hypothetical protein